MKKALSILLALCLLVGALPLVATAADSDLVIEDGVVVGYNGPGGDIAIPNGVTVVSFDFFMSTETGMIS